MPSNTGTKSTTNSGSVRDADSASRQVTTPQRPPVR